MWRLLVQPEPFDAGAELARLESEAAGGIASFIGVVRAHGQGRERLAALTIEHYPGMTERALARIADNAAARWPLIGCTVIHRVGRLCPGAPIVLVATASAHRTAALQATAFLIDWLKTSAPFWKAEEYISGAKGWVAARAEDEAAAAAW